MKEPHRPPTHDAFANSVIRLMLDLHPLDRIPRAGFLLRGVAEPESVAAHSFFLALLVCLVAPRCNPPLDVLKAARMALIHDLPECRTMDVPLTVTDPAFRAAKAGAETALFGGLFAGQTGDWDGLFAEFQGGESPEARLVKGLDKVQMMIKVMGYEGEGRGRLGEFWENAENFLDYGDPLVKSMFDEIFGMAGKNRP
jgi:putative hydrolase of HD superfamily